MLMFMKKIRKNKKGFTLTELIVVVAILGVLAAVATPVISNQVQTARTNADRATAKTIESVVSQLIAEGGIAVDADGDITTTQDNVRARVAARLGGGTIPTPQADTANHFFLTERTHIVSSSIATTDAGCDLNSDTDDDW